MNTKEVKKKRFVCEGTEYVVNEGHIVLLPVLMKPNYPPIEYTEERFHGWNGFEAVVLETIVNENAVNCLAGLQSVR